MTLTGSTACKPCDRAKFSMGSGSKLCGLCGPGTYMNQSGATLCLSCPAGRMPSKELASDERLCAVAKYGSNDGLTAACGKTKAPVLRVYIALRVTKVLTH